VAKRPPRGPQPAFLRLASSQNGRLPSRQAGGQVPRGRPISHSWPNGSTIRPRHQPCSSPTGAVSVAPAASACWTACWTACSGSSMTSSVRLVCAVHRLGAEALHGRIRRRDPECGTANAQLRHDLVPGADLVHNGCAKRGLIEGDCRTSAINPQLRLNARHRGRGWLAGLGTCSGLLRPASGHLMDAGLVDDRGGVPTRATAYALVVRAPLAASIQRMAGNPTMDAARR
jgi:hypothetical protein